MREVELKSVVDDVTVRRSLVEAAGGRLVYSGRLLDVRYDLPDRSMAARDHVLRLRVYESDAGRQAYVDWKSETRYEDGFKVREEISTSVGDPDALAEILDRVGYVVTIEIDRQIAQYELDGAVVRFEEYPDMDPLVEVEGPAAAIERAIETIGLPRKGFTAERLLEFVARFETRTGRRAVLST
jgi:predicted adenylyl cyclase CyaB